MAKKATERKELKIMALTKAKVKEILSTAGVEADKMNDAVDAIIDGHVTSIDALREERNNYKADAEKYADTSKELEELKKSVAKNEKDPYKVKYEAMKEEFEKYKADVEKKETTRSKESAYKELLKEAGVSDKRIASIIKVTNLEDLKIKDGKFEDSESLKNSIKEEWADFIVSESTKGAETKKPPINNGTKTRTKDEILAIKDGVERRKAMAENPELFGIGD